MTTERIRELGKIERTGKIGGFDGIGWNKDVSEDDWTFFYFAPAKGFRISDIMDEARTKLYGQTYLKLPPEIRDFQSVSPTCQSSREGKRHYSFHQTSESFWSVSPTLRTSLQHGFARVQRNRPVRTAQMRHRYEMGCQVKRNE